ncbi:hypothetical protein WR52_28415 (plasmid) [Bacillus cereus]|uniref:hypothetical protein n=2 Tax=Bacillaceae TaxID=186817 RepID=UPI0007B6E1F0|nr:hypothetical protein [Bacillus cereus]ANC22672.1 hypothetical protein WR52_28415 [Bacillus cereus]
MRKGYWNKSTALQVLHILLKEKYKMAEEGVLVTYDTKWAVANGLSTPLHNFWKNNPFRMLHDYNLEVYTIEKWEVIKRMRRKKRVRNKNTPS